ncbi:DUF2283 domain-containing protein [bacterium]|nr:DUF2283 domain-containing protein [bacterium]
MKIEYDPVRDLLYLSFTTNKEKVFETLTIKPGVHADFSKSGELMGIEIIDASEIIGEEIEFGLPVATHQVQKLGV